MAGLILDIRNPDDLTTTYDQIHIQSGAASDGSDMSTLATIDIDTTTATDLSMGFTSYADTAGVAGTTYYRFRYKNSGSGVYSSYSDIFLGGATVMHTRFRRKMRDTNSANYYFTNDDITDMLQNAVNNLFPHTYNEVIDESLTTLTDTEKYSFPIGVFRVNDIEFVNTDGTVYSNPKGWKVRARQIIFSNTPPTGYIMRLYADKRFLKFAEVPEQFDGLILDMMRQQAFETFEADRTKYYRYQSVANPEGGNLPSIKGVIERLELTIPRRLNSLRRVRRPSSINLTET
jgi:hypothetical protein